MAVASMEVQTRSEVEYSFVLHMDQPRAAWLERAKRKRAWLSVREGVRRLRILAKSLNIASSSSLFNNEPSSCCGRLRKRE